MIFRTIKSSIYRYSSRAASICFFASHPVDELWIRSTALQCHAKNIDIEVAISGLLSTEVKKIYDEKKIKVLQNIRPSMIETRLVVTATSGLNHQFFSDKRKILIHMPHSISSLHMIYPNGAFDGYDYLFSVGPHHDAEMETLASLRAKSVFKESIPCGYGKFDLMLDATTYPPDSKKSRILLAPSWGAGNILDSFGSALCDEILREGYQLILRPHPMFFIERKNLVDSLVDKFKDNKDFILENSLSLSKGLFQATALITDYSGIAQEYSYINGGPVIFVNVPTKILNNEWQSVGIEPLELKSRNILGPLAQAEVKDILDKLEESITEKNFWKKKAINFKSQYLHPGRCAENAVSALQHMI